LKGAGFQTEAADSPAAVLKAIEQERFDLVLMDLNYARDTTSGKEGLDLISRIQALDDELPIVVMTAWATVDLAVESMRLGVRDFVQKPWENSRLLRSRDRHAVAGTIANTS
jgi:DNA-binding NtrC family response regulator